MPYKCKDCYYFDSPEYPSVKEMGSCHLYDFEKMPAQADPCDEFTVTVDAVFRANREAIEYEYDRRKAKGEW